jgi:hypothetical protein
MRAVTRVRRVWRPPRPCLYTPPRARGPGARTSLSMASKRRASGSSSDSAHKASRAPATGSGALIHTCTLPPTCAPPGGTPTALPDGAALAAHTATYHTHVCAGARCRAVFPAARFLELVRAIACAIRAGRG